MTSIYALSLASTAIVVVVLLARLRHRHRHSLKNLRGPASPSWLFGNEYELFHQEETGDLDFRWMREYGTTWRTRGYFGAEQVMTADPKVLQHVYKAGYGYYKRVDMNHMTYLMLGPGILWAEGDLHHRHRRVMNPAFSSQQLRTFVPLFQRTAQKVIGKWRAEIAERPENPIIVNQWLTRGSLDIIGEAAFDYQFGALDGQENILGQEISGIIKDSMMRPPAIAMACWAVWTYLPEKVLLLTKYTPTELFARFRRLNAMFADIGRPLYRASFEEWDPAQEARRDVLAMLVKANKSEKAHTQLQEEEVLAQMHHLTAAAQETTAGTLSWMLYELAKHPEYQTKIRNEVRASRAAVRGRGDADFNIDDLSGMEVTLAAIKETLRYHPTAFHLWRVASTDDVLPLSEPIIGENGETITEIPISAGTGVHISVCGYHRLPSVWGDDAEVWNPDRFFRIDAEKQVKVGVYANLLSFSSGPHACIGWRFALYQLQAVAAELLEQLEFSLPEGQPRIVRVPAAIMTPAVEGRDDLGAAIPLRVSVAA